MVKRDGLTAGPLRGIKQSNQKNEAYDRYARSATERKQSINQLPLSTEPNVLHKYASYNTLFTLSVLSPEEVKNPTLFFKGKPHDVIIQSAGIRAESNFKSPRERGLTDTDKLDPRVSRALSDAKTEFNKNNDIYFRNVEMISTPGPNDLRKMTSVAYITMELVEPAGVTLLEKIKGAAANAGYLNHLETPYLLTIEFKGFDELGRPMEADMKAEKRVIPIKLATCEIDVDQAGSTYSIRATPFNEFGMVNTFSYPRTAGTIGTATRTVADAINEITRVFNEAEQQEVLAGQKEFPDVYRFTVDQSLNPEKQIDFELLAQAGMVKTTSVVDPGDANVTTVSHIMIDSQVNIFKTIEEIMKTHPEYGEAQYDKWFQKITRINQGEYNPNGMIDSFFKYFRIRSNITSNLDKYDRVRQVHPRQVDIVVEPYYISPYNLGRPGHHQGQNLITYVAKEYNHIFTGENVDILDLNINYKVAYFQSQLKDVDAQEQRNFSPKGANTEQSSGIDPNTASVTADDVLLLTSEVTTYKTSSGHRTKGGSARSDQFFDAINNPTADMVVINLEILGDPAWISQSQYIGPAPKILSPGISKESNNKSFFRGGQEQNLWNPELKCYNTEVGEAILALNFITPQDLDDTKGTYDLPTAKQSVFNGLYKVVKIQTRMNEGRFTQVLTMVRFNNQDKPATPVASTTLSKKDGDIIKASNREDYAVRDFTYDITGNAGSS